MFKMRNLSGELHIDTTGSEPRHIMLLNEDLPEVMMEKMEMKKRGSAYTLPHVFNITDATGDNMVDSSLLASLRVAKPEGSSILLELNIDWLRGIFISFLIVLFLVFSIRLYLWRRRHRRITACRHDPSDDDLDEAEQHVDLDMPPTDFMATEDFNPSNTGVSVPLLQEVTRL